MATSSDNTYASSVHKQVFDAGVQDDLYDYTYFTDIADVRTEDAEFIFNRFGSDVSARMSTDDTYVTSEFSYDKDTLGLTKTAYNAEHISMDEMVKKGFMIQEDRIFRHAKALAVKINRDTAVATLNGAGQLLDTGVLAGGSSDGDPIALSDTNADEVATYVTQMLQEQDAMSSINGAPYMIMRPKDARKFGLYAMNSGNGVGDTTILGGFKYTNFFGFDVFVTNDVPQSIDSVFTSVIDTDTITVAGVVFLYAATVNAAGDVEKGASDADALANLALAINGTGVGTGSDYFEVSASDRAILRNANIEATVSGSTLTITGVGTLGVASVDTTIVVDTDGEAAHILCGGRGTTVLRLPTSGYHSKVLDQLDGFFGVQIRSAQKYDNTVWTKTAPKIVNVRVDA